MNNLAIHEEKLKSFRVQELQTLLNAFGRNKIGKKDELLRRAMELLRTQSTSIQAAQKISELDLAVKKVATMPQPPPLSSHNKPIQYGKPQILADGRCVCPFCGLSYKNMDSYSRHKRKLHLIAPKATVKCPVDACLHYSLTVAALSMHMKQTHAFDALWISDTFDNMDSFEVWYMHYTTEANVAFVQHRNDKAGHIRLYCNRSGERRTALMDITNSTKHKSTKGTRKVNAVCPAYINRSTGEDGIVSMHAQLTHYGHTLDLKYVPIPESIKDKIVKLIGDSHRIEDIPGIVRKSTDKSMRGHFVETKDVRRIAQSNGLGAFDCRIADHQSVDAKMQLLMASEDSPVLFYRPATADQRLIVVLQTASMKKAMLEHGPYLLATDTTHDTSRYPGVLLGTLMTIGAAGEGQPVAFFIITSESEEQLTPVFAAIAQRFPGFVTRFFMSDAANSFWYAYRKNFDISGTTRQLCCWHVWRNWTVKLTQITTADHRKKARAALRLLASSRTQQIFTENYALLVHRMLSRDPAYADFTAYFLQQYPEKSGGEWAAFGRTDSDVSCNMHIEAYHRVVKKTFLSRQANRRLDVLLDVLLNEVAPYYEHLQDKTAMGKFSRRQADASKRHDVAIELFKLVVNGERSVDAVEDGRWVMAASDGTGKYIIERLACTRICYVTCKACDVCPHQFRCNCPDSINAWACKHSHLLAMLYGCREADQSAEAEQHHAAEESAVTEYAEEQTVDDEAMPDEGTETSTIDGDRLLTAAWQSAGRQMDHSIAAVNGMFHRSIPSSFTDEQRGVVIEAMRKLGAAAKALQQTVEAATSGEGFGASRAGSRMSIQPRQKAAKTVASSQNSNLIPLEQRKRKPRRDFSEDRRQLEAVKRQHLQVEAGMLCDVCKQCIDTAIDRIICDICNHTAHHRCMGSHLEDCGVMNVIFEKPAKKRGKKYGDKK